MSKERNETKFSKGEEYSLPLERYSAQNFYHPQKTILRIFPHQEKKVH